MGGVPSIRRTPVNCSHKRNNMATGILKVHAGEVVDDNGHAVVLRGAALGGWMK